MENLTSEQNYYLYLIHRWGLTELLSLWIHSYYWKQVDNNQDL